MARRTISLNSIKPGTTYMVRGKLTFSRITSLIDGEELQHRIDSARRNGVIPVERPHTTCSINNAQVVFDDPNNPSDAEKYATESLYMSKSNPQAGYCFNAYNKGRNLPDVGVIAEDGVTVNQIIPEGELANGLDVTLVIRVYKPKNAMNNGNSLDAVIVNEPVKYYNGSNVASGLKTHGLVWKANPGAAQTTQNQSAANTAPPVQQAPAQNPYNQQPQPVNHPADDVNPFSVAQSQNAQPAYEQFAPDNPAPAPAPASAPANNNQNSAGIRYDGSDRNY